MVLVDTSVWIDHLCQSEPFLVSLLDSSLVSVHPFVMGELACGNLKNRRDILDALDKLPRTATTSHEEAMGFLDHHELAGKGIGWVDMHLLASAAVEAGTALWTRDKRLAGVADTLGLLWAPSH